MTKNNWGWATLGRMVREVTLYYETCVMRRIQNKARAIA